MYLYIPVPKKLYISDCRRYMTVGICVLHIPPKKCCVPVYFPDISSSFTDVSLLALHCTLGQLRPYQLKDVVKDFLVS